MNIQKSDSCEAINKLSEEEFYEGVITLTAVASYNREEEIPTFNGKSILVGIKDPNISRHVHAYKYCVELWNDFFKNKITLEEMTLQVHKMLIVEGCDITHRAHPGKFRKNPVLIGGEESGVNEIETAGFIPPNYDKIRPGLNFLEKKIKQMVYSSSTIFEIAGFLHYSLAVLHPFHDGNGRVSRILAISLLESLGSKSFRGFTFISEILKKSGKPLYDASLNTESSRVFTQKIQSGKIHYGYGKDGEKYIEELSKLGLQEYLEELDIETPVKGLRDILYVTLKSEDFLRYIVYLVHIGKDLPGDHVCIWRLISNIIDEVSKNISIGNYNFSITIGADFLDNYGVKVKRTSVRNLLQVVKEMNKAFPKNTITIGKDFLDKAFVLGLIEKGSINLEVSEILNT